MVRVGEQQVSIGELEVALQDDLKFRASKIEAMVYASVPSHGRMLSVPYVNEQLFKLQLRAHAYQSRIKVIDDALASYSTSRMAAGRTEAGPWLGEGRCNRRKAAQRLYRNWAIRSSPA